MARNMIYWILAALLLPGPLVAQEQVPEAYGWSWVPGISFVRHFPGNTVEPVLPPSVHPTEWFFGGSETHRYESYGAQLSVRGYHSSVEPLVLTFGAGLHWYSIDGHLPEYGVVPAAAGIGGQLVPGNFTTVPVSAGLQLVFPSRPGGALSFFAGGEGQLVFIDGDVAMNEQVKGGYALVAGFSVRAFEFAARYAAFSDIRNLGIQLGVRFQSMSF